jgi:hypothetical protein
VPLSPVGLPTVPVMILLPYIKTTFFCSCSFFYLEDGGSMFFQNMIIYQNKEYHILEGDSNLHIFYMVRSVINIRLKLEESEI